MIERHSGTSHLPKAHYLNQRTMEIFRQHGVDESIYEVGTPREHMGAVNFRTSLGGDGALDAKEIATVDAFGGGALAETYDADGPNTSSNYPQVRLEPLLREHAEQRAPGKHLFQHELVGLDQNDDGVTATVRDIVGDREFTVRAQYMVAADGGKTVGSKLGIEMQGPSGLLDMVSIHFTADISEWFDGKSLMAWLVNPEGEGSWGSGVLVQMGPTWGASEEWVLHFIFRPDDPARLDEGAMPNRIRELLKLPELPMEIHKISHWILEGVLADRYQEGRIFLAGDAAHRHPPTTGLGLNTAFQDAHNLAWKLAKVLDGQAEPALLDTYEKERRPIGMRNVDWAMFTFLNHMVIDAGIGLAPGAPLDQNVAAMEALFSDTPMGETRRARAAKVLETQYTEFQAHDLEIGFRYDEGALVPDGSEAPPRDPLGHKYYPTTRPGHRLPHAWIERAGERVSTHDLSGTSDFVLIAGPEGDWEGAAEQVAAKYGLPITVARIGSEYADVEGTGGRLRQISDSGAVLVRPDNHVAWRATEAPSDLGGALAEAVETVLSR